VKRVSAKRVLANWVSANRVSANLEDTNPNPIFGESGFGETGRHQPATGGVSGACRTSRKLCKISVLMFELA